jgi:beta-aspartyl-peptidase (threonine type)
MPTTNSPTLIVHGGSGDIPVERHQAYVEGCRQAAGTGWAVLTRGGPALDAVEAAVRAMEDDPTFDAGRGSFLNAAGEVELDAIIMDGRDLNFGAVAVVQHVPNPVTLARLVMTECEHVMLAGAGAEAFARQHGLPLCPNWKLVVEREVERWQKEKETGSAKKDPVSPVSDTVGAVALDADGNLATATSTGGRFYKLPGRVGDSPIVGSGAYADNRTGAVSATGEGEFLMRVIISKTACDLIGGGMNAQEAADAAIALLAERTIGKGGLIVLDRQGRAGVAHNAPYIAYTVVTAGKVTAGIEYHSRKGH